MTTDEQALLVVISLWSEPVRLRDPISKIAAQLHQCGLVEPVGDGWLITEGGLAALYDRQRGVAPLNRQARRRDLRSTDRPRYRNVPRAPGSVRGDFDRPYPMSAGPRRTWR